MMEPATEKQLKFMNALNLEPFPNISKRAAKEMIAAKLEENESTPEVVKIGAPVKIDYSNGNGEDKYDWKEKHCRAVALECAIAVARNKDYTNEEFDMAKVQYFNWIWLGE